MVGDHMGIPGAVVFVPLSLVWGLVPLQVSGPFVLCGVRAPRAGARGRGAEPRGKFWRFCGRPGRAAKGSVDCVLALACLGWYLAVGARGLSGRLPVPRSRGAAGAP